jgi:hypothetical protein
MSNLFGSSENLREDLTMWTRGSPIFNLFWDRIFYPRNVAEGVYISEMYWKFLKILRQLLIRKTLKLYNHRQSCQTFSENLKISEKLAMKYMKT